MVSVLRIDGSIRGEGSRSRALGDEFVAALAARQSVQFIASRDVGVEPPRAPTEAFREANHTEPGDRTPAQRQVLAESDELIDELMAADVVVLATPMYNFSVGAGVKNWVDNLIRKDCTFRLGPDGIERLATDKRMVAITTRGLAYGPGSPFVSCDHLNPWLDDIFGFIGIDQIDHVIADKLDFASPDAAEVSMAAARDRIEALVDGW